MVSGSQGHPVERGNEARAMLVDIPACIRGLKIMSLLASLPLIINEFDCNGHYAAKTKNKISAVETRQMRADMKYLIVMIGEVNPVAYSRGLEKRTIRRTPQPDPSNAPSSVS